MPGPGPHRLQQLLRRLSGLLAFLLIAALPAHPAGAEKLVVGFEDLEFYPYGKPSAEEDYVGYLRALLDAYSKDQDHELEFAVTPLRRLFQEFAGREIDLFVPDNPDWSEAYKKGVEIYYSDTIAVALDGFAVLPGREQEVVGDDIVHIGAILGFTVEPLFEDEELKKLELDRASRFENIFRALFLQRVDAVHCNVAAANHVLSILGKEPGAIAWNSNLPQFKSEFKLSSGRAELIEEFNQWLRSHEETVSQLKERYGILTGEKMAWGSESSPPP